MLTIPVKQAGLTGQRARWWKTGVINGYQLPTGTIIVNIDLDAPVKTNSVVCIYARVSSAENKDNLNRQAERLMQYATVKGYRIYKVVKEVGSGLNDNRKQLAKILTANNYNILLVEHKDRLARFGINYMRILLEQTGRTLEIVNEADQGQDELLQDLISIITSFCSRIYGLRRSKRETERLIAELQANGGDDKG